MPPLIRSVAKHQEIMFIHFVQSVPHVGAELGQVLLGLVRDGVPVAPVGVVLLLLVLLVHQRHPQQLGEDHLHVPLQVLDLIRFGVRKTFS